MLKISMSKLRIRSVTTTYRAKDLIKLTIKLALVESITVLNSHMIL